MGGVRESQDHSFRTGNERLYEAYNDLHALAQDFEKPFDAPAILVVGHQTDGKSGTLSFRGPLAPPAPFGSLVARFQPKILPYWFFFRLF